MSGPGHEPDEYREAKADDSGQRGDSGQPDSGQPDSGQRDDSGMRIIRIGPPDPVSTPRWPRPPARRPADSDSPTIEISPGDPVRTDGPTEPPADHSGPILDISPPDPAWTAAASAPPLIELFGVGVSFAHRRRLARPSLGQHGNGQHGNGQHGQDTWPPDGHSRQGQVPQAALSPVDLTVRRGELVVITGRPGSGKSTLLNVIGLLDRPTTGRYLLNGIDTAELGDRDRTALRGRQIGFVFQRLNLLPFRSALDNVALPLLYDSLPTRQRRIVAADMLDQVGMAAQAHLMTWQLSVGQRQLVAIARAIVTEPDLLLCDNPTAHLGSGTAARVIALLAGLNRDGTTVLITTEDQLAAAYSSRSVPMGAGR